ncbi:uncharacterized protein METZ01_LOCUS285495, partial [marine metagenome]
MAWDLVNLSAQVLTKVLPFRCMEWMLSACMVSFCLMFANCASLPENAPANRLREAERALKAKEIDKETYLRTVIRAEFEQGRDKFEQRRSLM